MKALLIVSLCFVIPRICFPVESVDIVKISQAPVIDGILNDPAWQTANRFTGFVTFIPDFGKEMPEETVAWLAYDMENLYFAFKCYDREPGKIKARMAARDQIFDDDFICVNLDSYNDQQSLYAFYVNPLGIQADTRFAAGKEDPSVDMVWYSAGKLDDNGYSVEVRLPLKSIRYEKNDTVRMGLFLERTIARIRTHGSVPPMDPLKGYAFLTQFMQVKYPGIKSYRLFEVLPALTYRHSDIAQEGNMVKDQRRPDASLTLKYGLSSDLILDATLNPDFSQVEADAGEIDVNLRYQLLYPEKRPFFLEGIEKFTIAATEISAIDPIRSLVHTRTIVNPLTGIKLSGKAGHKDELNLLYSIDELSGISLPENKNLAHFPLFRYKRNLKNESYLGFLYTGRESVETANRVLGVDGQLRLNKSTLFEFNGFKSSLKDSAATRSGNSIGFLIGHDTRKWNYKLSFKSVDKDFHAETGYITRTGLYQWNGSLQPRFYPGNKIVSRIDLEVFTSLSRDRFSNMNETYNYLSTQLQTGGRGIFRIRYLLSNEIYLGQRFNTGGLQLQLSGAAGNWFSGLFSYNRMNGIYYDENPVSGNYHVITARLNFQVWSKFNTELNFRWYDFTKVGETQKVYKYPIERIKVSYQFNKYLFLRAVAEYNGYSKSLLNDLLLSFTYVPGTVGHIGYGSLFSQADKDLSFFNSHMDPIQQKRGVFIKLSYLIRS